MCVGSRHRLWGEAERTQPRPCPGRWGAWARHAASEPPVPPVKWRACPAAPGSPLPPRRSVWWLLARVCALAPDTEGRGCCCDLRPGRRGQLCRAHLRGCFSPGRESCEQPESPVEAGSGMSAVELIIPTAASLVEGTPPPPRGRGFYGCGSFLSTRVSLLSLKLCRVNGNPLTCSGRNQAIVLRPLRRSTSGRTCGVL